DAVPGSQRNETACTLQRHILPVIGDLKLAGIAPIHIENLVKTKLDSKSRVKYELHRADLRGKPDSFYLARRKSSSYADASGTSTTTTTAELSLHPTQTSGATSEGITG